MEEDDKKGLTGIIDALCNIMADVEAIGKTDRNTAQNFNFRSIDAVYNELHRLFSLHKVVCLPNYVSHDTEEYLIKGTGQKPDKVRIHRVTVIDYTFVAQSDGSRETIRAIGEGADYGDKSMSKSLAIADKYALLQAFKIPTEEKNDPDYQTFEGGQTGNSHTKRSFTVIEGNATAENQNAICDAAAAANISISELIGHYNYSGLEHIPTHMVNKLLDYLLGEAEQLNKKQ